MPTKDKNDNITNYRKETGDIMKYLTLGTDTITEEKFREIKDREDKIKPTGGLWLTEQTEGVNYNQWIDFIIWRKHLLYYKYNKGTSIWTQPCSIVTLKDNSNIYQVREKEHLDILLKNYPKDWKFSYQELSKDYDGLFIKFISFPTEKYTEPMRSELETFCVDTLLLFNPHCIDYYQKGVVNIEPFDYEEHVDEPIYEIKVDNVKRKVLKR